MANNEEKKKTWIQQGKYRILLTVLLLLLGISAVTGTLLARYISSNEYRAQMLSAGFHISSDYLEENGADYSVTDHQPVSFRVYNYEKENVAQVSAMDISYGIVSDWDVTSVTDENGDPVLPNADGYYTLPSGGATFHTVTMASLDGDAEEKVTVKTHTPYQKEMSATFTQTGSDGWNYRIEDKGSYVAVTLSDITEAGEITVSWDDKFSPDHSNDLPDMSAWLDSAGSATFPVEPLTVYELIFFKNTSDTYTTRNGSGSFGGDATIVLGGD